MLVLMPAIDSSEKEVVSPKQYVECEIRLGLRMHCNELLREDWQPLVPVTATEIGWLPGELKVMESRCVPTWKKEKA